MPKPIPRQTLARLWLYPGLGLILAACSPFATPAPTPAPVVPTATALPAPTATAAQVEAAPSATPDETMAPTEAASPSTEGQLRLVLAASGNEARYLVREQLAGVSLPSDAVGATSAVTGVMVLTADGAVVSEESSFAVDLTTLRSDSNLRDGFIQRNTLETGRFPTAEFVPVEALGLPSPLPTSGEVTFQLVGDLTLHGVTQRVTWDVTARAADGRELVGTAATRFTFGDFGMAIPRVARVLSIEDHIRLEYDFHLVLES